MEHVTVGLDGSPESLAAAHWAADEAERRKLTLCLLHAWPLLVEEPDGVRAEMDQDYWARRIVQNTRVELQAHHPGLSIVGSLVADDAEHALLQAASESEMTVLGSRGLVRVESYFLGDISLPVVAHAERPVVLVRAGTGDDGRQSARTGTGGVVVALKLHGPCDDLLRFAFEAAAARGRPLRAVHGRSLPVDAYVPWGVDHDVAEEVVQDAKKLLDRALLPWRDRFPQVEVTDGTALVSPAKAVVQAAEGADLLVVGRGRGRRRRGPAPSLGPVVQAAIHHARCPVAVVPHD
ncbi:MULTISPECIES: universal stress protein [unclassified Streptomyces]|uniref:universal stress protein n=1 Tax=unclassified Streptomyces TaxID=2593676 RepID=UPI00324EA6F1